jgi:hypothetical protein
MSLFRLRSFGVAFLFVMALAACSGGGGTPSPGGGGSPRPHATMTPSPYAYVLPSSSPLAVAAYNVISNPAGLPVSVDGASVGNAPQTLSTLSYGAHTVLVTSTTAGASPYPFKINENAGAGHTLLYNQVVDTSGTVAGTVLPPAVAIGGKPNLRHSAGGVMRRFSRYQNLPMFSSTDIAVHYDVSRVPGGRTFDDLEAGHGIARAVTVEQSSTAVTRVLTVEPGRSVDDVIRSFESQPGVSLADHVRLRYPLGGYAGNVAPNDTYYVLGHQWYLDVISASFAWGYGAGSVPIAVIDTGFDPSQTEVAPAVTFNEKIIGLKVFPDGATDTDGHGTFNSGVAGAVTNNNAGFAGVSYNAPLQEYKIFNNATTPTAQTPDEAAAIRDAVKNGAKVILLPFGGLGAAGPDPVERDAVEFAISSGVTVVAASGDDGTSAAGLDFPAAYDGVISVGASAINDTATPGVVNGAGNFEFVPPYSNASAGLTLVAPGGWGPQASGDMDLIHFIENVYTTQPFAGDPSCTGAATPADCRADYFGTSGASAQVAGTAALMLSSNGTLSPAQVGYILSASTDDIGDPNQGAGRLNEQRALGMVNASATPAPGQTPPGIPVPHPGNLVVFAYSNSGASMPVAPAILDATYPNGILVNVNGTFRIADIPAAPAPGGTPIPHWKLGVWYDANGDGQIGPGDYFGATAVCPTTGPCLPATGAGMITLSLIPTPSGTPLKLP